GTVSAVLVPGPGTPAAVLVPGPGPGTPAAVPVPGSEATGLREQETQAEVPDAADAVLVPGPDAVAAAAAVVAYVADASYESGEPSVAVAPDDERPLSYVPFYGIPYVPLPTVDRHRMRVRS
ncbi:hypothetical protein ABT082_40845, partial [Streptomyces massasporeus]